LTAAGAAEHGAEPEVAQRVIGVAAGTAGVQRALEIEPELVHQGLALGGEPGRALQGLDRAQRDLAERPRGDVGEGIGPHDEPRARELRHRADRAVRREHTGVADRAGDDRERAQRVQPDPGREDPAGGAFVLGACDEVDADHDDQRRHRERAEVQHRDVRIQQAHLGEDQQRTAGVAPRIGERAVESKAHDDAQGERGDQRDAHGAGRLDHRHTGHHHQADQPAHADERPGPVHLLVAHRVGRSGERARRRGRRIRRGAEVGSRRIERAIVVTDRLARRRKQRQRGDRRLSGRASRSEGGGADEPWTVSDGRAAPRFVVATSHREQV